MAEEKRKTKTSTAVKQRYIDKTYDIIINRKEVNALSKRKKKRGNKAEPDSYLNLVTAILNLVIAILLLIEKLTE